MIAFNPYSTSLCQVHRSHAFFPLPSHRFCNLRFVRTQEILEGDLPLLPSEFEDLVRKHCQEAHDILENRSECFWKTYDFLAGVALQLPKSLIVDHAG